MKVLSFTEKKGVSLALTKQSAPCRRLSTYFTFSDTVVA